MTAHPKPINPTPVVDYRIEREIVSIQAGRWLAVFLDDPDLSTPSSLATRPILALAAVQEFTVRVDTKTGEIIGRQWRCDTVVPVDMNGDDPSGLGLVDCINYLGVIPAGEDPYSAEWGLCPDDMKRPKRQNKAAAGR